MTEEEERQLIKMRIRQWAAAAPRMQQLRDEEVRQSNTAEGIRQLSGVAAMSLREHPSRGSSGLVEQQAWFMKVRVQDRDR